jgi:hypothetical protein
LRPLPEKPLPVKLQFKRHLYLPDLFLRNFFLGNLLLRDIFICETSS